MKLGIIDALSKYIVLCLTNNTTIVLVVKSLQKIFDVFGTLTWIIADKRQYGFIGGSNADAALLILEN